MRIAGIPVRLDPSWLFISVLLAWSFWARFTVEHGRAGRYQVGTAFVMAIVATVLFGASVLAHEVAHALVATHRGLEVASITLYLFGGATETVTEARRPGDEFALTAAGPLTNIALGAVFWLIAYLGDRLGLNSVAYVAGELGWLNLLLGAFNLIPGSPLDGGRLLESVAWRVTGDRLRATRIAAGAGQFVGIVLLAIGAFELFFVLGGTSGGIWLALTGWIILQGATAERAQAEMRRLLANVPAGRLAVMAPTVPGATPLSVVVVDWFEGRHTPAVFVVDGQAITGVLTLDDIRQVPRSHWISTPVGQVAHPIDGLPSVGSEQAVATVLYQLTRGPVVVKGGGGRLVGLLTIENVAAAAERMRQLERMGSV
jgi:Zn-dependent protease/CBS domain-containing protein